MKVFEYSLQLTLPCHVFTELCQLSPIQLSYQLSSRQFPTWKRSKPGGGGHPDERLQHHPSLTQGGSEKQRRELRWEMTIICNTNFFTYSHVRTTVSLSHPNSESDLIFSIWILTYILSEQVKLYKPRLQESNWFPLGTLYSVFINVALCPWPFQYSCWLYDIVKKL